MNTLVIVYIIALVVFIAAMIPLAGKITDWIEKNLNH